MQCSKDRILSTVYIYGIYGRYGVPTQAERNEVHTHVDAPNNESQQEEVFGRWDLMAFSGGHKKLRMVVRLDDSCSWSVLCICW
jgi:hypothetical protein